MRDGLVSVLIPTYNRARCIARAIDSALAQTHDEVSVLVVDDGSTDETGAIVRDTYGDDPRVRYVHQPNRGVSAARNLGIRLLGGDFVALLDSDDVWKPWKLEAQLACLRAFPDAGMVWSDLTAVRTDGAPVAERYLAIHYAAHRMFSRDDLFDRSLPLAGVAPRLAPVVGGAQAYHGEIYAPMAMGNLVHTSTVLLRRERLRASGLFDEGVRTGEDHAFHLATCRAGPVAFVDLPTTFYEVGAADALSRPPHNVPMARHFLRTLTRALVRDGARIRARIPRRTIEEVLADGHRWLGEALVASGQAREAQEHLLRSLCIDPGQPRVAGLYAAALLPAGVREGLIRAYREVKERIA